MNAYKKFFNYFISLRVTLLFIILFTSLVPLLIMGIIFYEISENISFQTTIDRLNYVADAERDDINNRLAYLIEHIRNFQHDNLLLEKITSLDKNSHQPTTYAYTNVRDQVNAILHPFQLAQTLTNIFLLKNDHVIYSTNLDYQWHYLGKSLTSIYAISMPTSLNQVTFSEVYLNKIREDEFDILMLAPLIDKNKQVLGQIAFEIPLSSLHPFLEPTLPLGYSTEALLLTKDEHRLISVPRFNKNLGFKVAVNLGSKNRNNANYFSLTDYRKQPVFAVSKEIDYLPWILINKIDKTELYSKANRIQHYALVYILIISSILALLLVIVASYLSRSITQPIKKLASVAKNIIRAEFKPHLDKKLLSYNNEIGLLANSLAEMSDELNKYYHSLMYAQLVAQEANRAKSVFLAKMSHELRTPLNAVIGYSEMLSDEFKEKGFERYLSDLDKITISGKHLLALINNVLDISKIEAGKINLFIVDFSIETFLDDISTMAKPLAEEKNNCFILECPSNIGFMHTDSVKLKQCLLNLISNACKFTENGSIVLRVYPLEMDNQAWIGFDVIDSGIGIPPNKLEKLFQAFSQINDSKDQIGTGLGLYISLQFCKMMGGTITVKSEVDQGSIFTILLPVSCPN